jgi:hypothetical protein
MRLWQDFYTGIFQQVLDFLQFAAIIAGNDDFFVSRILHR